MALTLKYRPEIDGLRAIAVLSVILYHARIPFFTGGFVGVDVFLVISGYLITTIIMTEIDESRFSIVRFYDRRIRRILPALYLVMAVCIPVAWLVMVPMQFRQFGASVGAVTVFASNILFWREEGYFAPVSELKPLLHTWSLAIEEQYYLLFPLGLLLLRRFGHRVIAILIVVAAVASLLLTEWAWRHAPSTNFYLAPTRVWELLAGSLCALLMLNRAPTANQALSMTGLAGVLVPVAIYSDLTPFPSLYALAPVVGACLIVLFATPTTLVGRLLGVRVMVGIGLISYSAYLWHQPLFAFVRLGSDAAPSQIQMLGLSALALALGWLSWRFVERPFRNRATIPFRPLVLSAAIVSAAFLSFSMFIYFTKGWEKTWAAGQTEQARQVLTLLDNATAAPDVRANMGECRLFVEELTDPVRQRLIKCRAEHGPGLLVMGDSHGIDLFGQVTSRYDKPFLFGIAKGFCRPHSPSVLCQYVPIERFVRDNPGIFERVLFEQAGFYLLRSSREMGGRNLISRLAIDAPVVGIYPDDAAIGANFAYLAQLAKSIPVTWYGPRLDPLIELRPLMRRGCAFPYRLRAGQAETYDRLDRALADRASRIANLTYVSQIESVKLTLPRDFMSCDILLWQDTDHYSAAGEIEFGKRMPQMWK